MDISRENKKWEQGCDWPHAAAAAVLNLRYVVCINLSHLTTHTQKQDKILTLLKRVWILHNNAATIYYNSTRKHRFGLTYCLQWHTYTQMNIQKIEWTQKDSDKMMIGKNNQRLGDNVKNHLHYTKENTTQWNNCPYMGMKC